MVFLLDSQGRSFRPLLPQRRTKGGEIDIARLDLSMGSCIVSDNIFLLRMGKAKRTKVAGDEVLGVTPSGTVITEELAEQ